MQEGAICSECLISGVSWGFSPGCVPELWVGLGSLLPWGVPDTEAKRRLLRGTFWGFLKPS